MSRPMSSASALAGTVSFFACSSWRALSGAMSAFASRRRQSGPPVSSSFRWKAWGLVAVAGHDEVAARRALRAGLSQRGEAAVVAQHLEDPVRLALRQAVRVV
jgi:hypothetical protein